MQKELIVLETTPVVKSWIHLDDKLIGVTEAGDYLLLATVQSMIVEKPKQKRRRKVYVIESAEPEARDKGNGEVPRRRGRKPSVPGSMTSEGQAQSVSV